MSSPEHDDTAGDVGRIRALRESGGYKSSTLIMSMLVLLLVVGGAVYVGVRGDDDSTDTAATPRAPSASGAPSAQPSAPATLPANAFGIPSTDLHGTRIETPTNPLGQVLPQTSQGTTSTSSDPDAAVSAPAGLMWQRVSSATLPFSTSDGPTTISADGVPSGFARTRQGAALAAWQLDQRAENAPDAQSRAIIAAAAIVDEASRPVVDKITNKGPGFAQSVLQFPPGTFDAPSAVKVSNYDGTYANVQLAVPAPPSRDDGFVATTVSFDMVWRDGRWKWVVPAAGTNAGQLVPSLDGFTAW